MTDFTEWNAKLQHNQKNSIESNLNNFKTLSDWINLEDIKSTFCKSKKNENWLILSFQININITLS